MIVTDDRPVNAECNRESKLCHGCSENVVFKRLNINIYELKQNI